MDRRRAEPFGPAEPFEPAVIERFLTRFPSTTRFVVAFSGGADSLALLHAFARVSTPGRCSPSLRAVHVDHHLHPDSTRWASQCMDVCGRLSVELTIFDADLKTDEGGRDDEGAARIARYEAYERILSPGDVLCTAHSADDHVETVLLNLLRGAGPRGLAGIPHERRLGEGTVARPVRGVSRAALHAYARGTGLPFIRDPANEDLRYARALLRRKVVPVLEARWPGMRATLARAAELGRESAQMLDALAAIDLDPAGGIDGETLDVRALLALSPARRRNAVAAWLRARGLVPPGTRRLARIAHEMVEAKEDATPCVWLGELDIRRFRGRLRLVPRERPGVPRDERRWRIPETLAFDHGELGWAHCVDGGLDDMLRGTELVVRFRGEDAAWMRSMGIRGHSLRKRFQAAGIPPWERGCTPLVFSGRVLAAIGSEWIDPRFAAAPRTPGWRVVWTPRSRAPIAPVAARARPRTANRR